MPKIALVGLGMLFLAAGTCGADTSMPVVIFNGVATKVAAAPDDLKGLWVSPADLTRATKLELKPEGICSERQCIPLPAGREKEFVVRRGEAVLFNLDEFARFLRMPSAHDAKHNVWYFGPRLTEQNNYLETLVAPNFTLTDLDGKEHSLADFRGKKVLLITWASW
jgi:hypothetical protein